MDGSDMGNGSSDGDTFLSGLNLLGRKMTLLGKTIQLKGISQKGKNRIRENNNQWVVLAETESVLFSPIEPGPWLFVSPVGCDQNHKASRWIKAVGDPDFEVE